MREIKIGQEAFATTVVDKSNTADQVGSGMLPVFSTPMLVALMEKAACEAIKEELDFSEGETSVGTAISISHDAASAVGATITARAEVIAVDRRRIDFKVSATDGHVIIGKGTHSRFVVDSEKFLAKLEK